MNNYPLHSVGASVPAVRALLRRPQRYRTRATAANGFSGIPRPSASDGRQATVLLRKTAQAFAAHVDGGKLPHLACTHSVLPAAHSPSCLAGVVGRRRTPRAPVQSCQPVPYPWRSERRLTPMPDENRIKVTQVDAELINIVDARGKRKMAIFDAARTPEIFLEGQEFPGLRQGSTPVSGITFYNGEGDECGGMIFGSRRQENGSYDQGLMLAFDAFRNDQVVFLSAEESEGKRSGGLEIWNRPTPSLAEDLKALQEMRTRGDQSAEQQWRASQFQHHFRRLRVGMADDGSVSVVLNDTKGRSRIRMVVDAQDCPKLEFLNEKGEVVYSLPPD